MFFTNIEGTTSIIAYDESYEPTSEINLDSTYSFTIDKNDINEENNSFIKFKGCRTYLFASTDRLYVTFESNKKTY